MLCDHSSSYLNDARSNAEKAGLTQFIEFVKQDFFKPKIDMTNSLLVFNPPYGTRQQGAIDIHEFYARIGDSLATALWRSARWSSAMTEARAGSSARFCDSWGSAWRS